MMRCSGDEKEYATLIEQLHEIGWMMGMAMIRKRRNYYFWGAIGGVSLNWLLKTL